MAKKTLLSEGNIRKFMKLAAIEPLTENFLAEAELEEEKMEEGEEMTEEKDPVEEGSCGPMEEEEMMAEATVKVRVGSKVMHTAAEGNGPVNALDRALRKALIEFYPSLAAVKLVDYKVRILDESAGTDSLVRVIIESSDGGEEWRTVGSSTNIIEASWLALADSVEYWLAKQSEERKVP